MTTWHTHAHTDSLFFQFRIDLLKGDGRIIKVVNWALLLLLLFSYVREPVRTLVCFFPTVFFFYLCSLYLFAFILVGWLVSRSVVLSACWNGYFSLSLLFAWIPIVKFKTCLQAHTHSELNIHFWFFSSSFLQKFVPNWTINPTSSDVTKTKSICYMPYIWHTVCYFIFSLRDSFFHSLLFLIAPKCSMVISVIRLRPTE